MVALVVGATTSGALTHDVPRSAVYCNWYVAVPAGRNGACHVTVIDVSPPTVPLAETTGFNGADGTGTNACAGIAVLEIAIAATVVVSARSHFARG